MKDMTPAQAAREIKTLIRQELKLIPMLSNRRLVSYMRMTERFAAKGDPIARATVKAYEKEALKRMEHVDA